MNSTERREGRYQRRKAAREARIAARAASCGDFSRVFSYGNLYKHGKKCCSGVRWKASTQRYEANIATITEQINAELEAGVYKGRGFIEFGIMERGHYRWIRSVHITERAVQKTLCNEVLNRVFTPSLIYDNGASSKGKGMDFALDRIEAHLHRHYRKHGRAGGILQWDFSGYFDSIPHAPLMEEARRRIREERVESLFRMFVEAFGPVGMGLGSEISQKCALLAASPIDHLFKDGLGVKSYGRYMDDGYLISEDIGFLRECLARLRAAAERIGLKINERKTKIVRFTRSFIFLKMRFLLTETGAVVRRVGRASITRTRRKLKKFRKRVLAGEMTLADVRQSYNSWRGHAARARSHKTIKSMDGLFQRLFGEESLCLSS